MALRDLTDRQAVLDTIAEFDAMGRAAFLREHGFAEAREYFIELDGGRYDSKAIAGVAHGRQHGTSLAAADFSGGDSTVANQLERLGFTVTRPTSLPDWTKDELALTLDLYLRTRDQGSYSPSTAVVTQLSDELRQLPIFAADVRANPRFRNPAGVALKLHNFSSIDPSHNRKGMDHGAEADRITWDTWASRPDELAELVAAIRSRAGSLDASQESGEDEEHEADEGRLLYRTHRQYERNRTLVARKKAAVRKKTGKLACEVCGFESAELYGDAAVGVVDVHHITPLHKIGQGTTTLADLALLCPNCHRVIHKHQPFITPTQLRDLRSH